MAKKPAAPRKRAAKAKPATEWPATPLPSEDLVAALAEHGLGLAATWPGGTLIVVHGASRRQLVLDVWRLRPDVALCYLLGDPDKEL